MLVLSLYILFSRTTTSIGRMMMMMIVVLRVCVSHLKRKWQHSPTLSWRCCTMQKCLLQKSPPLYIHSSLFTHPFPYLFFTSPYPSACYCCSWVMSIIVVQITRRNTYTVQLRERERTSKKEEGCCCCCFFQYSTIYIYSQFSSNACTSHTFCLFFSLSLSFSSAIIYALSRLAVVLVVFGIHRQGVMTRKERGEDVYGCMFGQTLNDERSQRSNPINCTKWKKKKITEMDGAMMIFSFLYQKTKEC